MNIAQFHQNVIHITRRLAGSDLWAVIVLAAILGPEWLHAGHIHTLSLRDKLQWPKLHAQVIRAPAYLAGEGCMNPMPS